MINNKYKSFLYFPSDIRRFIVYFFKFIYRGGTWFEVHDEVHDFYTKILRFEWFSSMILKGKYCINLSPKIFLFQKYRVFLGSIYTTSKNICTYLRLTLVSSTKKHPKLSKTNKYCLSWQTNKNTSLTFTPRLVPDW